ncbi:MAG: desulfoferrodoxin FeS4 iron-binding domain-containing protein [Lachnospiraceae bacterium]|nr:desulfoferrodoxin FeS4 iron-binding domain-containing protein [Lachnospiraceae bacterium]
MVMKFYRCEHCGNIVIKLHDSGVPVVCCGQPMTELVPGATDGAYEKHVPAVTVDGSVIKVQVGEVEHPMMEEHYIQFIVLETSTGYQIKNLKAGDKPVAEFTLAAGDKAIAVYEYCNLHGLWVKEV